MFACLRIPDKPCSMVFHNVLLHIVKDGCECLCPFYVLLISTQEGGERRNAEGSYPPTFL